MKHFLRIQRRFSTRQSSSVQVALGRGLGALLLAAVMTGCGSETGQEFIAEQITEALSGVEDIDVDGETISYAIGGENGYKATSGKGIQLPKDFPDDVLVYDDAEIISTVESADGFMVSLSSEADPGDIKTTYLDFFEDNDWQQELLADYGAMWSTQYTKGTRAVSLLLYPPQENDEPSRLMLTLTEDS